MSINTALLIVKGAVIQTLNRPHARAVQRIKHGKNGKSSLVFGNINSPLSIDEEREIRARVEAAIAENLPIKIITMDRKEAENRYGEIMLDESGIPGTVTKLRIVYLPNWSITASPAPFLSTTGLIGEIPSINYKFIEEKNALEVSVTVSSNDNDPESLAQSIDDDYIPTLREILPESSSELLSINQTGGGTNETGGGGTNETGGDDLVTPWTVSASGSKGVDYDKLVIKFGCQKISSNLIERFEKATGHRVHHFIRRGLFFSHRDFECICEAKEKGKPIYLYTGRGPSSEALHVGHLIPFIINVWLQKVLDCVIVIQLTDDEKFLFGSNKPLDEYHRCAYENAKDIMACGFDPKKTFIFSNIDYIGNLYPTILEIEKRITFSQVRGIFGFDESTNIGKIMFPSIQASPSFPSCFPGIFGNKPSEPIRCLIPCAIDQDPYFRMTRDLAPRMGYLKPSLLLCKFIPALQGAQSKMSGSSITSSILVTDDQNTIQNKINKFAFSGGKDTAEEQRKYGANLDVDVSYQYLTFFLEDDHELQDITNKYQSGQMLTGQVKQKLAQVLWDVIQTHQNKRAQITLDDIKQVMNPNRPDLQKLYKQL